MLYSNSLWCYFGCWKLEATRGIRVYGCSWCWFEKNEILLTLNQNRHSMSGWCETRCPPTPLKLWWWYRCIGFVQGTLLHVIIDTKNSCHLFIECFISCFINISLSLSLWRWLLVHLTFHFVLRLNWGLYAGQYSLWADFDKILTRSNTWWRNRYRPARQIFNCC